MSNQGVTAFRAIVTGFAFVISGTLVAQNSRVTEPLRSQPQPANIEKTVFDATEKVRAGRWNLDAEDWQRYRSLMQGIRGSVSPATLSPLEVLGIHARNDNERRQYAEQWAMMMRDDAERILAFQHAYDEAQQRLFSNTALIDVIKLARFTANKKRANNRTIKPLNTAPLDALDRVLFFTATDCKACDALLERLLSKLSLFAGLDVYLLNVSAGDDDVIRQWAQLRNIKPDWVQSQRVTLNRDAGVLEKLSATIALPRQKADAQQAPVVLRRRGDNLAPLSVYQF